MVEDLKELRNKLDRLIAKYEKEAEVRGEYRFEHDPRLADEFAIQGDDRLQEIGQQLLKLKEKESNEGSEEQGSPTEWKGNDIY